MPLTPAEKMRKYRLKLKENEEMQNKVKEKDRKCKANKRVQMNEKELRRHQKANRATQKSKKTTTPIKILKTAQSLGKAKNHVKKFLQLSPHHKKELLLSLANDFGIECCVRQEIADVNKGLPQETIDKVKSY